MRRLAVMFGLVAGCTPPPPHATSSDALRTHVELAELERGRVLLLQKCGACHRAPHPTEHTAAEWPRWLDEMAGRANLTFEQHRAVGHYLVAVVTRPSR